MNTPNKLTLTRIILLPVTTVWYFLNLDKLIYTIGLFVLFGVMELTDLLDGLIARRKGLVTDLGKILDPFADVICHLTFFTCFFAKGLVPLWAYLIILWRELAQSFLRMYAMSQGKAMAANIFGKIKTCFYAASVLIGFICSCFGILYSALEVVFCISAALSVISFVIYLIRLGDLKK